MVSINKCQIQGKSFFVSGHILLLAILLKMWFANTNVFLIKGKIISCDSLKSSPLRSSFRTVYKSNIKTILEVLTTVTLLMVGLGICVIAICLGEGDDRSGVGSFTDLIRLTANFKIYFA